ncbi:hypothetical protein [Paenibacillus polymyxa]|uniref:hypothetical protein n=1 Tax=Paenibacillus polymyxa TaxID=1406 RepID=UPI002ED48C22
MELMLKTYLPQLKRDVLAGVKKFFSEDHTDSHHYEVPTQLHDFKLEEDDPKLHLSLKGIIYYMETWR